MVAKIHYRWDFIQLSTDQKPTPEDSEKVVDGSTLYESDTSKLYVFYKDTWYEKTGTGGGASYTAGDGIDITSDVISVDTDTIQPKLTAGTNITIDADNVISAEGGSSGPIELTEADYNWPEDNPDHVSLFKLEPGLYYRNSQSVKVSVCNESDLLQDNNCRSFLVLKGTDGSYPKNIFLFSTDYTDDFYPNPLNKTIFSYTVWHTGTSKQRRFAIVDNLTTNESYSVLSAAQGKALNDKITALTARVAALEGN